ncbi:MAG: diguanylate cyclase [Lachnospiraceae bacterium]|nr:diguanylate cyclase [Lachnospiraceae bacterium]
MGNDMYWLSTLTYAVILGIYLKKDTELKRKPDATEKAYRTLLSWVLYFCLQDTLWGLCDSGRIASDAVFFFASTLFHMSTVLTTFFWLNYVLVFMDDKRRRLVLTADGLIIVFAISLLAINCFTPIVFTIREGVYVTEVLRPVSFFCQYIVFLFSAIIALFHMLTEKGDNRKRALSVFIFTCAPILLGAFQFLFTSAPFYSLAYFLGCVIIHVFVVAKDREMAEKTLILKPLIDTFHTMHLIDIENDTVETYIQPEGYEFLFEGVSGARAMVKAAFSHYIAEEYQDIVLKFVDLDTLSERMSRKNRVSLEFIGKNYGWSRLTFISVEKEDGVQKKVMLFSQNIDDEKKNKIDLIFKSNSDEMTGLNNRRAYEADLKEYLHKTVPDDLVFISMDINELKIVNDNIGHEAGDEIILAASKCMKRCFGGIGKVYRIGGDEFVAIIRADEGSLDNIKDAFATSVGQWSGKLVDHLSVSCGYVTKKDIPTGSLHDMSLLADKRMYEDKASYYRRKGFDRRGQKDSRAALLALYSRILKINITKDNYEVIFFDKDERLVSEKISEVFAECAKSGTIHADDLEKYIAQTNLAYMRDYFERKKASLIINYRAKKAGDSKEYGKRTIEIIPAEDYKDDDQNLYLYVRYF